MARSLNKTQLIGNLGSDPDIRQAGNGNKVANFTVATSESWKDKETGQVREKTEWHRVVVFGKVAEAVESYLRKGHRVYIEGKNRTREWEDQHGVKRWSTEVVVDMAGSVIFLEQRRDGQSAADERATGQYEAYTRQTSTPAASNTTLPESNRTSNPSPAQQPASQQHDYQPDHPAYSDPDDNPF